MYKLVAQTSYTLYKRANRAREMLRSGEIQGADAEKLRQYIGATPEREAAGLERGARGLAKSKGFAVHDYGPGAMDTAKKQLLTGSMAQRKAALEDMARMAMSRRGGGALTFPDISGVMPESWANRFLPGPQIIRNHDAITQSFGALGADVKEIPHMLSGALMHEADEARFSRKATDKLLKQKKMIDPNSGYRVLQPALKELAESAGNSAESKGLLSRRINRGMRDAALATPGIYSGNHIDPRVILNETRNNRMFPQGVQNSWGALRNTTGELSHMNASAKGGLLPKNKLTGIAKNMGAMAKNEISGAANAATNFVTSKIAPKVPGLLRRFI